MSTDTAAQKPLPETVDSSMLSDRARRLILESRKPSDFLLPPIIAKNKDPEVMKGAAQLEDMFKESLTPEEVAFHTPVKPVAQSRPPGNFLTAHMVIIDQLLMDPTITVTKLASVTGYSRSWLHKVMASDAFAAKLAERQKALVDPIVMSKITERIEGLVSRSLEILEERLEGETVAAAFALEAFQALSKATGMGVQKPLQQSNNFIVHMPVQMTDATAWAQQHGAGKTLPAVAEPLDITPTGDSDEPA